MSESTALVLSEFPALPIVSANFDEVRERLASILEDFSGTVVERSYYKQAKKDRAYLNNLSKSLNQRRREVKQHYLSPYEAFEARIKELTEMIAEASGPIDEQIKRIEEEMKAEKRAELEEHHYALLGIAGDLVPFERVLDPKWLNLSVSVQTAKAEIEAIATKLAQDEAALTELGLPHEAEAKAELFATLDLGKAIAKSRALEAEAERLRRFEEEKAELLAAQEAAAAEIAAAPEPTEPEPEPERLMSASEFEKWRDDLPASAPAAPPTAAWTFTVECTDADRDLIIGFIRFIGLTGRIRRAK